MTPAPRKFWGWGREGEGPDEEQAAGAHHVRPSRLDLARYRRILSSPRVWLLAPTWIALNAVLGSWTTQSVFQLVREPPPGFSNQLLMQGFSPTSVSLGFGISSDGSEFNTLATVS